MFLSFPNTKLKPVLFCLLSVWSVYAVAVDCNQSSGCIASNNPMSPSEVGVLSDRHQNVPSPMEDFNNYFGNRFNDNKIYSDKLFQVRNDYQHEDKPRQMMFQPRADIVVNTSFVADSVYNAHQNNHNLTEVTVNSDSTVHNLEKIMISHAGALALQNYPKDMFFNKGAIIGIEVSGNDTVDSQTDININSANGTAYDVMGKLNAHDHNINMNKDSYNATAVDVAAAGVATLEQVNIYGEGEWNTGLSVVDGATINFNNSILNLKHKNSYAMVMESGAININNSQLHAANGISFFNSNDQDSDDPEDADQAKLPHTVNLNSSSLLADDMLLVVNDQRISEMPDGDEVSMVTAGREFVLNADHSQLRGRTVMGLSPVPQISFNLLRDSSWDITGNSELSTLNLRDSTVSFSPDGEFKTLTINGNLEGNNGKFNMNTNLADQQSDKLVVNGQVHGQHQISVQDKRKAPKTPDGKVELVTVADGSGDGSFSMVQPYVDAGKYRYFLRREGNNWVLSNQKSESSAAHMAGNETAAGASAIPQYEISDFANSLMSMRQAATQFVYQLQSPTTMRLDQLRDQKQTNNMWLNSFYADQQFDSTGAGYQLATSGFKQKSNGFAIGYDHSLPLNDQSSLFIGGFVGKGQSSVDFNGDYKNGNIKAITSGIYADWQHKNGLFADVTYQYSHLKSNANKMDEAKWHANSISLNAGKHIDLTNHWEVVPQLGMVAGRLSGDDFTSSNHFYRTRAGAKLGGNFAWQRMTLKPYVGAYWLHDKNGLGHAEVDDSNLSIAGAGNQGLYEAGLAADLNQHSHVDLRFNYSKGNKVEQKLGAQLNYRYAW